MFREEQFASFFLGQGNRPSSLNNYKTVLRRVDTVIGGLDEKLGREGPESVLGWLEATQADALRPYLKDVPSITRKYIDFFRLSPVIDGDLAIPETPETPADPGGTVFRMEREMQRAVRRQLAALEPGLREADGGFENSVSTGRIDILAEDAQGRLVVIELKAGICPAGAFEQVLGYADAIESKEGRPVRSIVIAQGFSDRMKAAAKRMRDLELRTYEYALRFQAVE